MKTYLNILGNLELNDYRYGIIDNMLINDRKKRIGIQIC